MTLKIALLPVLLCGLVLAGCGERQTAEAPPPPHELTAAAIGYYCGMTLLEHAGPKAQIILASRSEPVWFSSARDAFSFTMLPEEPKDIRAIYVSDMAKAPSWDNPGWQLDQRKAGLLRPGQPSQGRHGRRRDRALSDRAPRKSSPPRTAADALFAEVPREYVLSAGPTLRARSRTHRRRSTITAPRPAVTRQGTTIEITP